MNIIKMFLRRNDLRNEARQDRVDLLTAYKRESVAANRMIGVQRILITEYEQSAEKHKTLYALRKDINELQRQICEIGQARAAKRETKLLNALAVVDLALAEFAAEVDFSLGVGILAQCNGYEGSPDIGAILADARERGLLDANE